MFCHGCGSQIQPDQPFCGTCGTATGIPPREFRRAFAAPNRVSGHVRNLGILWIVLSALRLLPAVGIPLLFSTPLRFHTLWPFGNHFLGLIGLASGIWALSGLLGLLAGWGLLDRQPWARTLAIVLGIIALIHIPFGTALGIYTLWVLLPNQSEAEYRRMVRA
jgi:hypothetical protein